MSEKWDELKGFERIIWFMKNGTLSQIVGTIASIIGAVASLIMALASFISCTGDIDASNFSLSRFEKAGILSTAEGTLTPSVPNKAAPNQSSNSEIQKSIFVGMTIFLAIAFVWSFCIISFSKTSKKVAWAMETAKALLSFTFGALAGFFGTAS